MTFDEFAGIAEEIGQLQNLVEGVVDPAQRCVFEQIASQCQSAFINVTDMPGVLREDPSWWETWLPDQRSG